MDQWEDDFRTMASMGVNTIRVWLLWNRLEPQEGLIDTSYLDILFELGDRYKIGIGCLFHLHAAPEWAVRKYPSYYYKNSRGIPFYPTPRSNTPSGGWPGLCYDNDEVQEVTLDFIDRVVRYLHTKKPLFFWEPMNEPHIFYDWLNNEEYCYCEATAERFRKWLQEKYHSVSDLNRAWGRRFNDFSQVMPPHWNLSYSDWIDWRSFIKDNLVIELQRRIEVIKRLDNRPVVGHSFGGSQVQNPRLPSMAFDDWDNAQIMDGWGCSGFPSAWSDTVGVALAMDVTRSAGKNCEVWQSELGCGQIGTGMHPRGEISRDQFAMWTWLSIAHGAKGVLYWQYRKERHGVEANSHGLVSFNGKEPNESGKEFIRISQILQEHKDLFLNTHTPSSEVAILFSPRSYSVFWCENNKSALVPARALLGYYHYFWQKNIPCDIIHETHFHEEDLARYKLILLPFPVSLNNSLTDSLKKYVAKGGVILSDPFFCSLDQNFHLDANNIPGRGFDAVFGVTSRDLFRPGTRKNPLILLKGQSYHVDETWFFETYHLSPNSLLLASYSDGSPAIVSNRYGEGTALLSGVNLGLLDGTQADLGDPGEKKMSASRKGHPLLLDLFRTVFEIAKISPSILQVPDGVLFRLLEGAEEYALLFLFNSLPDEAQITLNFLDRSGEAEDLLCSGLKKKLSRDTVSLKGYETKIFKIPAKKWD
ncbi:MAG: beta-galactosidase [Candidatus Ratteibacteria bacterium]